MIGQRPKTECNYTYTCINNITNPALCGECKRNSALKDHFRKIEHDNNILNHNIWKTTHSTTSGK